MGGLDKPPVPYKKGRIFRIQSHVTPPPTPVTRGCCKNGQAGREERSALSPLDRCVRHPPLLGKLGARFLDLKVLEPVRVGDYHNAQIFLAATSKDQSLQSERRKVVAKVYDPLYFNDDDGYLNPFLCVDKHYTHEVHTYKLFSEFQGGLVPEFYGSFSLDPPGSGSELRTVRLILIEHIPGPSMLQAKPGDFSQQCRQQIIKSVIDFECMAFQRDIMLNDLSPRNTMLPDSSEYPQRRIVFLDFGTNLFMRMSMLESDDGRSPVPYTSPILRWNWTMVMEFTDWIDWDFRPWVRAVYARDKASITQEMKDTYCPLLGTEVDSDDECASQ